MTKSKIRFIAFSLLLVFLAYGMNLISKDFRRGWTESKFKLPDGKNLESSDSALFTKEALLDLQLIRQAKATSKPPISLLEYAKQYRIMVYPIPLRASDLRSKVIFQKGAQRESVSYASRAFNFSRDLKFEGRVLSPDTVNTFLVYYEGERPEVEHETDSVLVFGMRIRRLIWRPFLNQPDDFVVTSSRTGLDVDEPIQLEFAVVKRSNQIRLVLLTPACSEYPITPKALLRLIR
ncbi:MAG: hypothetical protein EOP48_26060 [Sphingobacteriales bacterium]|nr:MAG: hypothetical protein EOP48_26060 [Sphingobacteriales bacterium]